MRTVHAALLCRRLPDLLGVYFHELEQSSWDAFSRMVEFLCREQGYQISDPTEFVAGSSPRRLFISFDDNHWSWYEARRLFDQVNARTTFYVNTLPFECAPGSPDLAAYYRRIAVDGGKPLTRAALKTLRADGHTIGAHTHSHPALSALPEAQARQEMIRSKEALEDILGEPVIHFSYPYGMRYHFNESLRQTCLALGFRTVANAIPAMLHGPQRLERIQRSFWRLDRSLDYNLTNLRIDGRWFERLTGRSAVI